MFDFKNGALTIDTTLSVADTQALNAFADTVRNGEMERIIKIISEWDLPVNQGTYTVDDSVKSLIALIKEKK